MRFIHTADVHLGACPDAGKSYTKNREKEIWYTFEKMVLVCEEESIDLLLIAGDLFHRQPLMRELKEVDYLFSKLTHTKVVFIAGNHDYLKKDSNYRKFRWESQVYFLEDTKLDFVEFPELKTCVYGLSYDRREICEPLYDSAYAEKRQPIEILLAHGGDEKHIPVKKQKLLQLGYDYIALGHIHRMQELVKNSIHYSGSLEPTDKNDIGQHGYIKGEIKDGKVETHFVPFASREYIHLFLEIHPFTTNGALRDMIAATISKNGVENIYKITLQGFCSEDFEFDANGCDPYGNILEIVNDTKIAFDFNKLYQLNAGNLIGNYIASFGDCEKDSVEYEALFEGVFALLHSKRGS